ncbi:hypothetical protein LTR85_004046 [Meristemomyces frigidus]|nr:hypothetical protein LTR85_004046 [Meristemomyces frigidus]
MTDSSVLTLKRFLTIGIVPLQNLSPNRCHLCKQVMTSNRHPCQTPCGHCFCTSCVKNWAVSGQSWCPFYPDSCDNSLYYPGVSEDEAQRPDAITTVVRKLKEALDAGTAEKVGRDLHFNPQDICDAAQFFAVYHRSNSNSLPEDFSVLIDMNTIDAHLVAFGNLSPALAFETGTPYTSKQTTEVPRILEAISTVCRTLAAQQDEYSLQGTELTRDLKAAVHKELAKRDIDVRQSSVPNAIATESSQQKNGLDSLLDYLLLVAHRTLLSKPTYKARAEKRARLATKNVRR